MHIDPHGVAAPRTRKPMAFVVRDPAPEQRAELVDWSDWYLTDEDDVGESIEQFRILWLLLSSLGELASERGWTNVLWAGDTFFAWVKDEPLVRVSPDAYLLDDPPPHPHPKSWQTWLPGHKPPRWAVEVVSEDWKKDYENNPLKYAQLGARELVIFDPEAPLAERGHPRVPLQIYRRGSDGAFMRVYRGDGPVWSEELDAAMVIVKEGTMPRLRLARDIDGTNLVPTAEEAKLAAQQAVHAAEQAAAAAEQAAHTAEQSAHAEAQARLAAEARVRDLEAQLAKLRGA